MIDYKDIEAAAGRLEGVAVETPLLSNRQLDEMAGGTVLVKPECLQVTGSFKIRGAYNFLSQLGPDVAQARRRRIFIGQSCAGCGGGWHDAGHPDSDRHAGGCATGETREHTATGW